MYITPWSRHHWRISSASMFQARSIRRSPAPTCLASSRPMFSSVTRSRTKRTPFAVHGLSLAVRFSKSITVTFFAGTWRCLKRIGSVHSATAP